MKLTILLFLATIVARLEATAQANGYGILIFTTPDFPGSTIWFYRDTIHIKSINDTSQTFHLTRNNLYKKPVILDYLREGEYVISYKNKFREKISTTVCVQPYKPKLISISPDELTGYPQNTLSKFKDGDSLVTIFHTQGCFEFNTKKIVLRKTVTGFYANLYSGELAPASTTKFSDRDFVFGDAIATIKLESPDLELFRVFENKLNFAGDGGSTTNSLYKITSPYLNLTAEDSRWVSSLFYSLEYGWFRKSNPVPSKKIELQESIGLVTIDYPPGTDTFFTWTHKSDCGKSCDQGKYRFQMKSNMIFKESGFFRTGEADDSLHQLTISHSLWKFPFTSEPAGAILQSYPNLKINVEADVDNKIESEIVIPINGREFAIFNVSYLDQKSKIYIQRIFAFTMIGGNELCFKYEHSSKTRDENSYHFFDDAISNLKTVRLSEDPTKSVLE